MKKLLQMKFMINIVLSIIAIAVIVYYSICGNSCSYLKGTVFGIDLQYVGISYMAALILLSIFRTGLLILICLSAGIGVEAFLIGFQIFHGKYCPYCLVFGAIILMMFALNFEWKQKWLMAAAMIISLILFAVFFMGTAFPTYAFA